MFDTKQELISYLGLSYDYLKKSTQYILESDGIVDQLIDSIIKFDLLSSMTEGGIAIRRGIFKIALYTFEDNCIDYTNYEIIHINSIYRTKIIREVKIDYAFADKKLPKYLIKTDYNYKLTISPELPPGRYYQDVRRYNEHYSVINRLIKLRVILPSNITLEIVNAKERLSNHISIVIKYIVLNYIGGNPNITFNNKAGYLIDIKFAIDDVVEEYINKGKVNLLNPLREVIENGQLIGFNMDKVSNKSKEMLLGLNTFNIKSATTVLE